MKFADVILPLPLDGVFTYAIPTSLRENISVRLRVLVPLGPNKQYIGVVKSLHDEEPAFKCRGIISILDDNPIMLDTQLSLWHWISDYYLSPIGDVYKAAFPSGFMSAEGYRPRTETCITLSEHLRSEERLHETFDQLHRAKGQINILNTYLTLSHYNSLDGSTPQEDILEVTREDLLNVSHASNAVLQQLIKKGILSLYERNVGRLDLSIEDNPTAKKPLSSAQQVAFDNINASFTQHDVTLLHGVTSSGKTEIYIHLIWQAIESHKQVLYLLPEIALTIQIMERLQRVFGKRLGIYHSKYSDEQRVEIWQKQMSSEPFDIILGARSAVFLPFQRLGLVIIDEEHETSYKQQDPAPRYHARSVAIMLAHLTGAKTLLGTATPSMESYYNTTTKKYGLVELETRYKDIELPEIIVVDTKDLMHRKLMKGPLSPLLMREVRTALANGQQAILFQNRRGYSPFIECHTCGWVPKCQNCDVSLTYHATSGVMSCHFCGHTYAVPDKCPCCEETDLRRRGYGTERIEDYIRGFLPNARIARMDLDTTRTRSAYERIISDFAIGKTNLLIGTQMVSKGLDFDNVAVVGILSADSMTNMPDFRAYENAFMMMSQVSGRAGRKGKRGKVILQTRDTKLPLLNYVVNNDYKTFFHETLEERKEFNYPPFSHIFYIYLRHRNNGLVEAASIYMTAILRKWFGNRLLGPDRPAVARVKQLHVRKLVLKIESGLSLKNVRHYLRAAAAEMAATKQYSSVQIVFDADPL